MSEIDDLKKKLMEARAKPESSEKKATVAALEAKLKDAEKLIADKLGKVKKPY
jgi:hypothetical protein